MGPAIERMEPDKGGDAGQGGEGHRRNRRIEHGPRGRHPLAAAKIVHQDEGHARERQPEPKQIGAQPGAKKTGRVDRGADRAADDPEQHDSERGKVQTPPGSAPAHCKDCRLSGGTSARLAFSLACNVRI